jgi:hypothetical protein
VEEDGRWLGRQSRSVEEVGHWPGHRSRGALSGRSEGRRTGTGRGVRVQGVAAGAQQPGWRPGVAGGRAEAEARGSESSERERGRGVRHFFG